VPAAASMPCTSTCMARWWPSTSTTPTARCCDAVRDFVGPGMPVVASLDFHANVSKQMASQATALVSYRTYPHVDMADCGGRAARVLHDLLRGATVTSGLEQVDFLIPLTSQSTLTEPLQSLMAEAQAAERSPILSGLRSTGLPGRRRDGLRTVRLCLRPLIRLRSRPCCSGSQPSCSGARARFALELYTVEQALREIRRAAAPRGPAGHPRRYAGQPRRRRQRGHDEPDQGTGRQRHAARARRRDLRCECRGKGARGGRRLDDRAGPGCRAHAPPARRRSRRASRCSPSAMAASRARAPSIVAAASNSAPWRCLELGGVRIAVASRKQQAADQAMFRHLRAEPSDYAVLALKSSVHFRADFGPLASSILVVEVPGPNLADPAKLPFTKLRPGMRTSPRRG